MLIVDNDIEVFSSKELSNVYYTYNYIIVDYTNLSQIDYNTSEASCTPTDLVYDIGFIIDATMSIKEIETSLSKLSDG